MGSWFFSSCLIEEETKAKMALVFSQNFRVRRSLCHDWINYLEVFSQNCRVRRNLCRDWINYVRRGDGGQWEKGTRCFMTQLRTVSSLLVIYHSVTEHIGTEGLLCARCYSRLGKHSRTRQRPYPKGAFRLPSGRSDWGRNPKKLPSRWPPASS